MNLLRVLFLCIVSLPLTAHGLESVLDRIEHTGRVLEGYREDSVTARMASAPLHDVEGLWEVAGEGTLMAVERVEHEAARGVTLYAMVVVRSASLALRPGTVMGYLTPGADRRVFDTRIYSGRAAGGTLLDSPKKYTATLSAEGEYLSVKPYGRKLNFNWWRLLLPYMYRSVLTATHREAGAIEGFRRVYPEPVPPLNPRYL